MCSPDSVTEAPAAPAFNPAKTVTSDAAAALPKTYDPAGTEERWQRAWEEAGAFHRRSRRPG